MSGVDNRTPAKDTVASQLGTKIVTGAFPPGSVLPSELDLSISCGVSRGVVREALSLLSGKGLIESRKKYGTRVRERSAWSFLDPDLLRWMFEGAPPRAFVRDLFELRMFVEPRATELAAQRRTASQVSRLGHSLEVMSDLGLQTEGGRAADQTFHAIILEATHNEVLISLSAGIGAAVRWTTFFKYRLMREPRNPIAEHRSLFEAIVAGDAAAAREVSEELVRLALADTEALLVD